MSSKNYTASDIEVLEGLEAVRLRPGMYVGGTDINAFEHLIKEVFDNAMDEVLAGYATEIYFTLGRDNTVQIRDNGRGIPIDDHPKFPGKSALEIILTTLHSGGKFGGNAYGAAGGLHGVGVSVVNALTKSLEVKVVRDNKSVTQQYSRGKAISNLEDFIPPKNFKKGTEIIFQPDEEIFGNIMYEPTRLYKFIKAKAYLNSGVIIYWECDKNLLTHTPNIPQSEKIYFPGGLIDYIKDFQGEEKNIGDIIFSSEVKLQESDGKIAWAIAWSTQELVLQKSYCNTINTPQGGTHESAFRTAIFKAIKNFAELLAPGSKKNNQITADDVFMGVNFIISVFMKDAQFAGQTKEKLISTHITRQVENLVKANLDNLLISNKNSAEKILELIYQNAEERLSRRKDKEISRKSITQKLRLPGKLADCSKNSAEDTELFIVEGESAGGSAKQARMRESQAVLPLKGKILNVANSTVQKIKDNQELNDLYIALGCRPGKHFDVADLRYGKIIIMTDADVDGAHISSLLMTFFILEMPDLIKQGRLYLAQPPLFKITQGVKIFYARDAKEKDAIVKKLKGKADVTRFKGLGEMTAPQLKETTMNPATRRLLQVQMEGEYGEACAYVENLMGRKAEFRYNFIQSQALEKNYADEELLDI